MEILQYLLHGFGIALQPINLFYCFVGVLTGTLVGVMPGIGPVAAVALLLPTTYYLPPVGAIIMLAGINYGAMYGGSTTSILINVPGETSSVVTCFDGYQMALQGRAGPALGIAAFASFIAGTLSVVGLMLFATVLSRAALHFGPPEYFTLMLMSLTLVTYMARGSMIKALMMAGCGLILSTVGMDLISTKLRLTYKLLYLQEGIQIIPVAIGLFGLGEVFVSFQSAFKGEIIKTKIKGLLPTLQDWKDSIFTILRCGTFGFFMGILPGVHPAIPTFISYGIEKKLSKHPEKFGTGVIEGVAGPEACNNATVCGNQIPLFSLGIPTNIMNAMLLAAFMIWGMTPGPQFIKSYPDLFWGLVCSMYIGNVLLLMLNLPLIPLWVRVLKIPQVLLNVLILMFCVIGAYSINQQIEDVYLLIVSGAVGFLGKKLGYEFAPLILAFVLGTRIEISLRQSLIMSDGNLFIFLTRPLSAVFGAITLVIISTTIIGTLKAKMKGVEGDKDFRRKEEITGDRISGFFLFLFGIFIIRESVGLSIGRFGQPGAGFLSFLGASLLVVLSAFFLLQSILAKPRIIDREARGGKENPRVVVFTFMGVLIYVLIFEWLGFIISTFLLVTFLLRFLDQKKWWHILLTAGIVSSSTFIIFNVFLKLGLPEGLLSLLP